MSAKFQSILWGNRWKNKNLISKAVNRCYYLRQMIHFVDSTNVFAISRYQIVNNLIRNENVILL